MRPELILASSSPRRRDILTLMKTRFTVCSPDADERVRPGTEPADAVLIIASRKAGAVALAHPEFGAGKYILAADTVVDLDGKILGKPADAEDAARMLKAMSGRTHLVHTGVCVMHCGVSAGVTETTSVRFAPLSDGEIAYYISTGEPFGKAGSYAVQGLGARYVSGISGDYFNVMGMPVFALDRLLDREWGITLRDFC
ncbi:MAG: septum formation protein Maf [Clostridia bacterium]|nr:septum formation protein Maf [Clostridia bacterium]